MDLSDHEDGEVQADAYDDLDFAPTPSGSRPGGASDGYHLTNVLKLPRATTYSTQSLYGASLLLVATLATHAPLHRPSRRRGYQPGTRVPARYVPCINPATVRLKGTLSGQTSCGQSPSRPGSSTRSYATFMCHPSSSVGSASQSISLGANSSPPVAHQHDDGSETKTCIDGKQRLTSIHRYVSPSFLSSRGAHSKLHRFMDGLVRLFPFCTRSHLIRSFLVN
jgi:hypothetical protein